MKKEIKFKGLFRKIYYITKKSTVPIEKLEDSKIITGQPQLLTNDYWTVSR
jgi:hypothetical protein